MNNLFKIKCNLYDRPDIYRKVKYFNQEISKYTAQNDIIRQNQYNIDSIELIQDRNIQISKNQIAYSNNNNIIKKYKTLIEIEKQKLINLQTQALIGIEPRPTRNIKYTDNSNRDIYYGLISRSSSGNRTY